MKYDFVLAGGLGARGLDAAERLLDDLVKTDLGRQLLGFLEEQGYKVCVTQKFPKGYDSFLGLANYGEKRIYIRPDLGPADTLRVFAHETRHVGQEAADAGRLKTIRSFHPVNAVMKTWLREMDAEAFAMHFVFNHEQRAGGGVVAELLAKETNNGRAPVYKAYMDGVLATSGRSTIGAMRTAFYTFMDAPNYADSYAAGVLTHLNETFSQYRREHYDGALHKYFKRISAADPSGTSGRELLYAHAQAYSQVFASFGSPDYLRGESPAALEKGMNSGVRGSLSKATGSLAWYAFNDFATVEEESRPTGAWGVALPKAERKTPLLDRVLTPHKVPKELKFKF